MPDGYTPSNAQWDYILSAKGVQSTEITDRLFGNTSGLLMKDKVYDNLKSKYGNVDINAVNKAVKDGTLLGIPTLTRRQQV